MKIEKNKTKKIEVKNQKVNRKNKPHDTILKYILGENPEAFLELVEIKGKFLRLHPTENVTLLYKTFEMDALIEMEDRLVNIEFQSPKNLS